MYSLDRELPTMTTDNAGKGDGAGDGAIGLETRAQRRYYSHLRERPIDLDDPDSLAFSRAVIDSLEHGGPDARAFEIARTPEHSASYLLHMHLRRVVSELALAFHVRCAEHAPRMTVRYCRRVEGGWIPPGAPRDACTAELGEPLGQVMPDDSELERMHAKRERRLAEDSSEPFEFRWFEFVPVPSVFFPAWRRELLARARCDALDSGLIFIRHAKQLDAARIDFSGQSELVAYFGLFRPPLGVTPSNEH